MIGYEFEFIVHEGDRPLSKEKFLQLHKELQADGWKPKHDPDTGGFTGSTKDGMYVTTDDGVGVMEINMPPTGTVQESHERLSSLLDKLQEIYRRLGCSIVGTSVYPGEFDVLNPKCREYCLHPDCCEKSIIKLVLAQRLKENHHYFFLIAANHIWLDLPKNDVATYLHTFNRLSPVIYALCANGPLFGNKKSGLLDTRDEVWKQGFAKSLIPHDSSIFGYYQKEPGTIFDYFDFLMDSPPYFLFRNGAGFKAQDGGTTMHDVIYSEKTPATWGKGGDFVATPSLEDIFELQHTTFPHARLKFFLREGLTVEEFKNAYASKDEQKFLDCFAKFCLEVRSVGAQKKGELSAAPAFLLGIQENIEKARELVDTRPYSFWTELHAKVQKDGLQADHEGVSVVDLARSALDIAEEGLRKRGKGEGQFLKPIRERIEKKQNPAQELLAVWEEEGMEGVYKARDF